MNLTQINPSASSRRVMVAWARHDLESFLADLSRENVAQHLPGWHSYAGMTDDERAEVLAAYSPAEPPAVPFVDYLPTLQADADAIVASLREPAPAKVLAAVAEPAPVDLEKYDFGYFNPTTGAGNAVIDGEVTSPFGPCSGLADDKRDNTCTNFAAEYVSYESDSWSDLTCRRLCTSCANAAPNVVTRSPLTTAPGGYPVERAS